MKRFDLRDGGSRGPRLEESVDGEVVLYSDVAPLVEALKEIQKVCEGHTRWIVVHIDRIVYSALSTIDATETGNGGGV